MSTLNKTQRFPLGLVLFALALAVYKAAIISVDAGAGWQAGSILFGLDLFYLSFLLLLAIVIGILKPRILRWPVWFLLLIMTAIYLVDSFVLLALDDHADLFDIGRYGLEDGVVLSFFDTTAYVLIASLVLSLFISSDFSAGLKKLSMSLWMVTLLLGIAAERYSTSGWNRYAMLSPASVLEGMSAQKDVSNYSKQQIAFYADQGQQGAEIPAAKPNIILVVVESLSSINSNKTSGVGNLLAGFDELAEEGVLFRNFFANHQASEGGVIALLSGFPPIHFPAATPYMFDEFAIQPSVIGEYQQQGYFTEFLTNSDLSFIGLSHFLDGLGLDRSRGRDESESMRDAVRVVQDAPSDQFLYDEAIASLGELSDAGAPFLMVLATTSTHLPYAHPEGGPDSAEAVWRWSLQQLTEFHRKLQIAGYFDNGILLITGDHRQMRRLTKQETQRYGASARARVPLLILGNDYPENTIDDRFFQQSDLLRKLDSVSQADALLSPHPIWVERYNRKYGRLELIDNLSVFDQANEGRGEYQLTISGNHIDWMGDEPDFARNIELQIHKQRSQHQNNRKSQE